MSTVELNNTEFQCLRKAQLSLIQHLQYITTQHQTT